MSMQLPRASVTMTTEEVAREAPPKPLTPKRKRGWGRLVLPTYTALVILYLMFPIFVMIVFGFNKSTGRVNSKWLGFTLQWYRELFTIPALTDAIKNSLIVATISTVIATILGTMVGLALGRYRFRGRQVSSFVLFLNIAAPEVVLGAALLALFVTLRSHLGLPTIIASHVMFNIAYVAVVVRARVTGFDRSMEDAAQDLFADPWTTFRKVTFPLIFPAVLSGALLAFALSIDDFVITQFVAGPSTTFPLWVFGAARIGIPPQVNVLGTLIFMGGVLFAIANAVNARRKERAALRSS